MRGVEFPTIELYHSLYAPRSLRPKGVAAPDNAISEGRVMTNLRLPLIFSFAVTVYTGVAYASEVGTPEDARAML